MEEKIIETKTCKHCATSFDITDKDRAFYDKISPVFDGKKFPIPTPQLCPECRLQRRLSFRHERKLYRRKCDFTGKEVVSIYSPESPYTVYEHAIRRSDQRDPLTYGREFDPEQSFFAQLGQLLRDVPRINLNGHDSNENSAYVNYIVHSKNTYLCFWWGYNEDVMYANLSLRTKDSCDVSFLFDSDECYEVINCTNTHDLAFAQNCDNCSHGAFLEDCINCHHCILCSWMVNKEYCYLNTQYTKEEFLIKENEFHSSVSKNVDIYKKEFKALSLQVPKRPLHIFQSENCLGDYIYNSKNLVQCFSAWGGEDCKYCDEIVLGAKDSYDAYAIGLNMQLSYEMVTGSMDIYHCLCSFVVRGPTNNIYYCWDMSGCSDCFACIGLKNAQYCIFNKQYAKKEYEKEVSRIITSMQARGERGEFLPSSFSPFCYNETLAMDHFPLTKQEALKQWFKRSDYESPVPQAEKMLAADQLPDIHEVTDEILQQAIICEVTGKPFRVIKQELEFYRRHGLPLPRRHPDQRHKDRMSQRNPRKLFNRSCMKCWVDIKTSYSTERKEIVYCESCYNKEIY